jgi:DNA-binding MarR family transcriptional regulator
MLLFVSDAIMGKRISLTVDERVILHLLEFSLHEEDFEAPEGTTQAGIALGIGIARKHVPRAVNKLINEGLVATRVSHVKGAKQRKKVYYLTLRGKELGRRLWETLAKKEVVLHSEDGCEKTMTVSELCFTYQVGKSPVQIILDLREGNVYYPNKTGECRPESGPEDEVNLEDSLLIYRKALNRAWDDNILTREEAAILSELRTALKISDTDHRRLQEDILGSKEPQDESVNRIRLFSEVLDVALRDGKITQDEQEMLDELRRLLGIEDDMFKRILVERTRTDHAGAVPTEGKQDIYSDIYSTVLRQALKEGKTGDEREIILLLKKLLSMEDRDHALLLDKVRKYD